MTPARKKSLILIDHEHRPRSALPHVPTGFLDRCNRRFAHSFAFLC
jgi:hypothetical protein